MQLLFLTADVFTNEGLLHS